MENYRICTHASLRFEERKMERSIDDREIKNETNRVKIDIEVNRC